NRHLPAWWEWANIRLFTRRRDWTPAQQKMMRRAGRYHGLRFFLLVVLAALLGWGSWEGYGRLQAQTLRDRLPEAHTADVPDPVAEMAPYRRWVDPLLEEAHAEAQRSKNKRRQLHLSLALLPQDPGQVEYLVDRLLRAEPQEVLIIRGALAGHQGAI